MLVILLCAVPFAWAAAAWNQWRDNALGVPSVTILAPDGKPVLSLDYDPNHADRLLIAAGDETPGGGAVLWEATDKSDSELPLRDAGAFGRVPVRRNRTLRAYSKGGGNVARFSPDGKYLATWSNNKLTVWRNDGFQSVPLRTWTTDRGRFYWDRRNRVAYQRGTDAAWEFLSATTGKRGTDPDAGYPPKGLVGRGFEAGGSRLIVHNTGSRTVLDIGYDSTGSVERLVNNFGAAHLSAFTWSRDYRQLALADSHGWMYRFEKNKDGRYIPALKRPRFAHAQNPAPDAPYVTALAFSPDGKTLATGGTDGAVFLWRLENTGD